jgi:hypothetical protein
MFVCTYILRGCINIQWNSFPLWKASGAFETVESNLSTAQLYMRTITTMLAKDESMGCLQQGDQWNLKLTVSWAKL